jgi:hypothetical protein
MEENGSVSPEGATSQDRVEFRFLKSTAFRVIHVDGAWGGVTQRGDIHMVLYSERPSIPDALFNELTPEGKIGAEIPEAAKGSEGIVREVEVDAIMTLNTAKALHIWLTNKISYLENAIADVIARAEAETKKSSEEVEATQ